MRTVLLLLLALCGPGGFAQTDPSLDSLAAIIEQLPDDTTKVRRLFKIGQQYNRNDARRSFQYYYQAWVLAEQLGSDRQTAILGTKLGGHYANQKVLDSALYYFEHSLQYAEPIGDLNLLGDVHNGFLYVYKRMNEYDRAAHHASELIRYAELSGDPNQISKAYGKSGSLLFNRVFNDEAYKVTLKAYEVAKEADLPGRTAYAARLLGDILVELGRDDEAEPYLREAMDIYNSEETYWLLGVAMTEISIANILIRREQYKEALTALQESDRLQRSYYGEDFEEPVILDGMSMAYVGLKQYDQAIEVLRRFIALGKQRELLHGVRRGYLRMAQTFEELSRFDSAYHYHKLFHDSFAENLTLESAEQIGALEVQVENAQQENTILQQEQQIVAERNRSRLITGGLVVAIVVGGILFYLLRQLRRRDAEKEVLIKEIHHRVKNNLQVLSSLLYLQGRHITDDAALDAIRESQNRVESMGLIHQKLYMDDTIAGVEMHDYIDHLADNLLDSFGIRDDRIRVLNRSASMHLDVDTAIPMGLIINELVTNSLKYAFPNGREGTIEIEVERDALSRLVLRIKDDGVGKANPGASSGTSFGTNLVKLLSKKLKGTPAELNGVGHGVQIVFEK